MTILEVFRKMESETNEKTKYAYTQYKHTIYDMYISRPETTFIKWAEKRNIDITTKKGKTDLAKWLRWVNEISEE